VSGRQFVATRSGRLIDQPFTQLDRLSGNILKHGRDGKFGCVLASGEEVLPLRYEQMQMIDGRFIAAATDEKWGVFSLMGEQLLPMQYDGVQFLAAGIVTVWKDEKIALVNLDTVNDSEQMDDQLHFKYEEVELIGKQWIWCYAEGKETLLDTKLTEIVPLASHQVYVENDYLYTKSDIGVKIYDQQSKSAGEEIYQDILVGKKRLALRKDDRWNLLMESLSVEPRLQVDSIYFPNDRVSIIVNEDIQTILFENNVSLELQPGAIVESVTNGLSGLKTGYFLVSDQSEERALISPEGEKMFSFKGEREEKEEEETSCREDAKTLKKSESLKFSFSFGSKKR
ncbi:MAG: hypothetical protein AAFO69_21975, partial [Bacteroidota bacterium]